MLGWKNAASFGNGTPADLVIGQPDFFSSIASRPASDSLCTPAGVAVDGSGNLYVADSGNSRVLEYTSPFTACGGVFPCVGGPANLVFGQGGGFTSSGCDTDTDDGKLNRHRPVRPLGVAVDGSGNVYVADSVTAGCWSTTRPLTTDVTADQVFGQGGDFTANTCNFDTETTNPTANDLCDPTGVALDGSGNLYVADTDNSRVLEYTSPLSNSTANTVLGQGGDFTSNDCDFDAVDGSSSNIDLCSPAEVAVDAAGDLYVADIGNNGCWNTTRR